MKRWLTLATLPLIGPLIAASPVSDKQFGGGSIVARWSETGASISPLTIEDRINHRQITLTELFTLTVNDGRTLTARDFQLLAPLSIGVIEATPNASRVAERFQRRTVTGRFVNHADHLEVIWRLIEGDGSYLRQEIQVMATGRDAAISRVGLFRGKAKGVDVVGRTAGSPVVAGPDYAMAETPLAQQRADTQSDEFEIWIDRKLPLRDGQSVRYSAAVGATHPGQLRREFGAYLERERAHPYRPFLHYNSWYDIGYFNPYTEADALNRIHAFGEALVRQRKVQMDSFLFDDGWDDRSGSWNFSKAFPNGFSPLAKAAASYGAGPGVWLSPWGGYGEPKAQRVAGGRKLGYEIVDEGLALSGANYYDRFHSATLDLVKSNGINQFKLDGTGNADRVVPGSKFDSDFAAAIQLTNDLRIAKPDLLVNITTGTYPSPAWLMYADSIWRGGEDHAFTGVGTQRQRWITYRDRETYQNIVQRGPLFPLNALMLHGVIFARQTEFLGTDPGGDFAAEVHSYFGSGTGLQELYITPDLMTPANWDILAEAANWSRANAAVLRDTHWVGGDPSRSEIYGWAAWSATKSLITLRNPSEQEQSFALNLERALDLPEHAKPRFSVTKQWLKRKTPQQWDAQDTKLIKLMPFEVVTYELIPL